ncbi:MAG: hypothetical protein AB1941_08950 [Gemmatimonadota bacterium]
MSDPSSKCRTPRRPLLARAGLAVWLTCGLVLSFSAAGTRLLGSSPAPRPTLAAADSGSLVRKYRPSYELRSGKEVVLVFLGASFCGAHRRPGFPQLVEDAKERVQRQAQASGRQFRAHAVSLDWKTDAAMEFLQGFGEFDEMSLGGNWVSDGAVRYVWRDMPGDPVVPQIILPERTIDVSRAATEVKDERVLKRVLGTDEIEKWVRAGAPL